MGAFSVEGRRSARSALLRDRRSGLNHNGQLDLAHRLVDAAADAAVDAIKFQTFDADALTSHDAPKAGYQARATGALESQRDMLRRLALTHDAHVELKRHAEARGLVVPVDSVRGALRRFPRAPRRARFKIPSAK